MAIPILGVIGDVVDGVLDKFVVDKSKKLEAKQEVLTKLMSHDAMQAAINKQEAAHKSLFVAGWRPFIGWSAGATFVFAVALHPIFTWILNIVAIISGSEIPPLPNVDASWSMELIMAMLGFGGLRTFEKLKGVSREK